ncbi:MAG TPA: hypothetical protein VKR79_07030 [Gaiellaceae bacterium]|nr:hypothetical protein [Gaiellaceae bacterium]
MAIEPAIDLGEAVEDPGLLEFVAAGSDAAGEFRCADCGYGVVVHVILPQCPMCRGSVWERREARLAG